MDLLLPKKKKKKKERERVEITGNKYSNKTKKISNVKRKNKRIKLIVVI